MRWITVMALCATLLAVQPVVEAQQEVIITADQYSEIINYISYLLSIEYILNFEIGPKLLSIKNATEALAGYVDGLEGYLDGVEPKLQSILDAITGMDGMLEYLQYIHNRLQSIQTNTDPLHGDLLNLSTDLGTISGYLDYVEYYLSKIWEENYFFQTPALLAIKDQTDQIEALLADMRDGIFTLGVLLSDLSVTVTGSVSVDFAPLITELHNDLYASFLGKAWLEAIYDNQLYGLFKDQNFADPFLDYVKRGVWDAGLQEAYLKKIRDGTWDWVNQEAYLKKIRDGTWDWEREEGYPKRTAEALWDYNYNKSRVEILTETNVWGFTMLANLLGGATTLLSSVHGTLSSNVYVSGVETSALPDYGEQLLAGRTIMDGERQGFADVHVETLGVTNSFLSAVTNRFNWLSGWQDIEPQYSYYISLPWPFNTTMGLDWSWAETTLEIIKSMIAWALYATAAVGAVLVLRSGIA